MSTVKYKVGDYQEEYTGHTIYLAEVSTWSQADVYVASQPSLVGVDWNLPASGSNTYNNVTLNFASIGETNETKEADLTVDGITALEPYLPLSLGGKTINGVSMPASSQYVRFNGTFRSNTYEPTLGSGNAEFSDWTNSDPKLVTGSAEEPETYHIYNGQVFDAYTYDQAVKSVDHTYNSQTVDQFADKNFKIRIMHTYLGPQTVTKSVSWNSTPTWYGTWYSSWQANRYVIDGLEGDTAPSIAVDTTATATASLYPGGQVTATSSSSLTATGNVIWSAQSDVQADVTTNIVGGYLDSLGETNYTTTATVDATGSVIWSAESDLATDYQVTNLAGIIQPTTKTLSTVVATNIVGGYLHTIDETLASDVNIPTQAGIIINTGTYNFASDFTQPDTLAGMLELGQASLQALTFELSTARLWVVDPHLTVAVEDENRDFYIKAETRGLRVVDEGRDFYVKQENRAIEVEQETRITPSPREQAII